MELYTFKYEPKTFDELIVNDNIREILEDAVNTLPNLMFSGPPGIGKSASVKIILRESGVESLKINASAETSIETVRDKITRFAVALGMTKTKVIVLNEMDQMSSHAQNALKDLIEEVHKITRFFFITNYPMEVTPEILSRFQHVEFNNPPADQIYKRLLWILEQEKIKNINKKLIVKLIRDCYPDIRLMINNLQLNCKKGTFSELILHRSEESYENIFQNMVSDLQMGTKLERIRKELRNAPVDYRVLYTHLFEKAGEFKSPGDMIILIGDYLDRNSRIANREINFIAMMVKALKKGYI